MQEAAWGSRVKILRNYGYDLFYSVEGGAILLRTPQLGDGFCPLEPSFPISSKTATLQTLFSACAFRSSFGWLDAGL